MLITLWNHDPIPPSSIVEKRAAVFHVNRQIKMEACFGDRLLALIAGDYQWHPEKSLVGPVTIIMSRSDQQAVVMRNGVEIGRTKITMPATDFASHILTLTIDKAGARQWMYVGAPGHMDDAGRRLDSAVASQVI